MYLQYAAGFYRRAEVSGGPDATVHSLWVRICDMYEYVSAVLFLLPDEILNSDRLELWTFKIHCVSASLSWNSLNQEGYHSLLVSVLGQSQALLPVVDREDASNAVGNSITMENLRNLLQLLISPYTVWMIMPEKTPIYFH